MAVEGSAVLGIAEVMLATVLAGLKFTVAELSVPASVTPWSPTMIGGTAVLLVVGSTETEVILGVSSVVIVVFLGVISDEKVVELAAGSVGTAEKAVVGVKTGVM